MDISALVQNFGFPIAIAVYFIWRDYQSSKEHKADLKDIATKAVSALGESTEAVKDATAVIGKNSDTLGRVEGVILGRGQHNDSGNSN